MSDNQLTPETVKLNEQEPDGYCAPGKSLIHEVEKLRNAVLLLCDLQRELATKLDAKLLDGKAA